MFVTHDLDEAIALADRVVIMSAGPRRASSATIAIDLPRPRDAAEVRLEPPSTASTARSGIQLKAEVRKIWPTDKGPRMKPIPRRSCSPCRSWSPWRSSSIWHVGTTVPIVADYFLRKFFFSTPIRCLRPRLLHVPRYRHRSSHLWITLVETILAFVIGSAGGIVIGFWFARKASGRRWSSTPT
jgi:hypothetical protein